MPDVFKAFVDSGDEIAFVFKIFYTVYEFLIARRVLHNDRSTSIDRENHGCLGFPKTFYMGLYISLEVCHGTDVVDVECRAICHDQIINMKFTAV